MRIGQKIYDREGLDGRCFELVDISPPISDKRIVKVLSLSTANIGDFVNLPLAPTRPVAHVDTTVSGHLVLGNLQFVRRS